MKPSPLLVVVNVLCLAIGLGLAVAFKPEAWPWWRTLAAGGLGGFGVGLLFTVTRLLGAYRVDESN